MLFSIYYDVLWCHGSVWITRGRVDQKNKSSETITKTPPTERRIFPEWIAVSTHPLSYSLSLSLARCQPKTTDTAWALTWTYSILQTVAHTSFKSIFNCLDEWLCSQRTKWAVATVLLQILQLACLRQKHTQPIKIVGNYELWGWLILILILNTPSMIGSQTPSAIVIKKIFLKSTRIN